MRNYRILVVEPKDIIRSPIICIDVLAGPYAATSVQVPIDANNLTVESLITIVSLFLQAHERLHNDRKVTEFYSNGV